MSLGNPVTSEADHKMTYDVLLSFRGEDIRTTFTGHLYNSLLQRGIKIFIDDELPIRGEEITRSLVEAIEESRIAIIVFSENYATSTFCLDELVKILDCIKGKDQIVLPVFYHVDPSEIRHPRGIFKDALAKHEERFKDHKDKMLKWRLALDKAANLSGIHFKSGWEYEHELVGKIVEVVSRNINPTPLHIANHPVGLEPPLLEVISLLELGSDCKVNMVGIYGMGGLGKTTIARAVYNHIADQFEGACFLADVRENSIKHGLVQLQKTLLGEAVGDKDVNVGDVCTGIPIIKRRLQHRKILLVLDDVDKLEQLFMIAGGSDWFGNGSRIIITTRDKHLLACHGVHRVYEVKGLNHKESLELFSWNAFKNHEVDSNFLEISNRIVLYAGGHPLALEVMGSYMFGKRIDEWSSALDNYESETNNKIHEILKMSYDDLDEEEKEVFLDIACFWKGDSLETVKHMLDASGFHPEFRINVLIEKSLLKIDGINCVTMHDLIQEMGKEIVRQQSTKDVGKDSRLWFYDDTESRSSSSFTYGWTYDVFLSFLGKDTRTTFTGNLYHSLRRRGIKTFIDDEGLRRGEGIIPSLVKAIQESRISIIVFSENYASSTFCLDELVIILECIMGKGPLVWPVFYNVDPSEIRHCRGIFKDALAKHEKRFKDNKDKVLKWRLALREAANLSGWHLKSGSENEHEIIGRIVEEISRKINRTPLHIANHPVGLEPPLLEVISLLGLGSDDRVNMVGIYGMGGIGKTTIARAVYNHIADQFEGTCFLADVRENSIKHGLVQLQKTLLGEAVGDRDVNVGDVCTGIPIIKRRLQQRKILLVLDDVDKLEQLFMIAGGSDWFGNGSRIIITTRDKHLLACHGVHRVYEVKGLNHKESLELFSWNAFKNHEVDPNFLEISNRIVLYAGGHPLALEVMGSYMFGKRIDEWSSALDNYESVPNKKIHEILKMSYDDLDEEEKEIFLDIACCFKGESLKTITYMLDACCFHPKFSIKLLVEKSLLEIDNKNCVTMHNLIQEMGKEIVRQQSTKDVGKHSRLWFYDDIVHVLEENMGSDKIEVIILDPPKEKEVHWNGKAFKKMKNLRILIIRNTRFSRGPKYLPNSLRVLEWLGYPSPSLPCDFHAQKLVSLKLQDCCFIQDKPQKIFECMSLMDFTNCDSLRQIPDLSSVPNLRKLSLNYSTNLIGIDDSVGLLNKLEILSAYKCTNLTIFPSVVRLPSLQRLNLSGCGSFLNFPEILEENRNDLFVGLEDTAIVELPSSIKKLVGLKDICLSGCRSLNRVPSSILMLPVLKSFHAMFCTRFQFFESCKGQEQVEVSSIKSSRDVNLSHCDLKDEFLTAITSFLYLVDTLNLSGNSFTLLPASFKECCSLRELYLDNCKKLQEIKGIPPNIECFSARNCTSLSSQSSNMLLRQAILETNGDRKFILPGERVPEWFDYSSNSASLTFWFRNKFPVVAFCIVLEEQSSSRELKLDVRINGTQELSGNLFFGSQLVTDHIFFYSQRLALLGEERQFLKREWNRVDVLQWIPFKEKNIIKIKGIGININKQETSMEDIRFEDPYHQKVAFEEICYRGNDLDSNCFPSLKKQRRLLCMGVGGTSDIQQQKHSTLINTMTPMGYGIMSKHTKNNLDAVHWDSTSNISVSHSDTISGQDSLQQQHLTCMIQQGAEECESADKAKGKSITARSNIDKKKEQEWLSVSWSPCLPVDEAWDSMMAESTRGASNCRDKGTQDVLEDLVAEGYLAVADIPLLREFFAAHPTMHLSVDELGPRLFGWSYTCLVDLLKFLQTHSALDMSLSEQAKFTHLLREVRHFGFDGDWVDSMEERIASLVPNEELSTENLHEEEKGHSQMDVLPSN